MNRSIDSHPIYKVTSVRIDGPYVLTIGFDDETSQTIDFEPVLRGELFEPLRDPGFFGQVAIDPEIQTLVWPNGADFDPATLHDWPEHREAMIAMVARWELARAS